VLQRRWHVLDLVVTTTGEIALGIRSPAFVLLPTRTALTPYAGTGFHASSGYPSECLRFLDCQDRVLPSSLFVRQWEMTTSLRRFRPESWRLPVARCQELFVVAGTAVGTAGFACAVEFRRQLPPVPLPSKPGGEGNCESGISRGRSCHARSTLRSTVGSFVSPALAPILQSVRVWRCHRSGQATYSVPKRQRHR